MTRIAAHGGLDRLGGLIETRLENMSRPSSKGFTENAQLWFEASGQLTPVGAQHFERERRQILESLRAERRRALRRAIASVGVPIGLMACAEVAAEVTAWAWLAAAVLALTFAASSAKRAKWAYRSSALKMRQLEKELEWARTWASLSDRERAELRREDRVTAAAAVPAGLSMAIAGLARVASRFVGLGG